MSSSQLRDSILLPNWIPTVKSILFQRTKDKNNCLDMIKNQSKNTAYDLKLLRKKKNSTYSHSSLFIYGIIISWHKYTF